MATTIYKFTKLVTRFDTARSTFDNVDRYLADDFSETASIEADRAISAIDDLLRMERFVKATTQYI